LHVPLPDVDSVQRCCHRAASAVIGASSTHRPIAHARPAGPVLSPQRNDALRAFLGVHDMARGR
jgi:hypothetical protein